MRPRHLLLEEVETRRDELIALGAGMIRGQVVSPGELHAHQASTLVALHELFNELAVAFPRVAHVELISVTEYCTEARLREPVLSQLDAMLRTLPPAPRERQSCQHHDFDRSVWGQRIPAPVRASMSLADPATPAMVEAVTAELGMMVWPPELMELYSYTNGLRVADTLDVPGIDELGQDKGWLTGFVVSGRPSPSFEEEFFEISLSASSERMCVWRLRDEELNLDFTRESSLVDLIDKATAMADEGCFTDEWLTWFAVA